MIGKNRLSVIAGSADEQLRGAARAACAELEAARWSCVEDVRASFPSAASRGCSVTIELDERHRLVFEVNYENGVALIIYAGRALTGATAAIVERRRRS